ncbi:MAG: hypothetical protein E7163_00255 [Firmicutes bacterium]|nr:hypothetical protein [Bacillota bacterium]
MRQHLNSLITSLKVDVDNEKIENINAFREYFKNFFKKYPARDFFKASEMTFEEVMTSVILINNPYKTKIIIEIIEEYSEIFVNGDYNLISALGIYYHSEDYKELIDTVIFAKNEFFGKVLRNLLAFCTDNEIDTEVTKLLCEFLKDPNTREKFEVVFKNLGFEDFKAAIDFHHFSISSKEVLLTKDAVEKRWARKNFEALLHTGDEIAILFTDYFNRLHSKYNEILGQLDRELKEINRHNKKIDDLRLLLNAEGEIKDIEKVLRLCPDEEIKVLVINYILNHNKVYYEGLIEQYNDLKRTSDESLTILFAKYNYDYLELDDSNKNIIKNLGYDKIKIILQFLYKYKINLDIMNIIFIDINKLKVIEGLLIKGCINKEFIEANLQLLFSINDDLDTLLNNINILSRYNINIINYSNSLNILLNKNLLVNLKVLNEYNINVTRETKCISFLNDNNLIQKIDMLIEMGLYAELNTLDVLNLSIEQIYKKKIFLSLNIELNDVSWQTEDFITSSETFIPCNIINTLNSNNMFDMVLPEVLLDYKINNYILFINGVYVSINRLLRNLSKFDLINNEIIFYSIIYGSNYSLEEIDMLSATLLKKDIYTLVRS